NELVELPREIGHLNNLTVLDLSKNQLRKLPDTIGCLLKLKELKLNQNQLTYLPRSIGNLKKLNVLNLSNNNIKYIPKDLGKLINLINLDLSHNPVKVIPAEIAQLQFLRKLKLESCPLWSVEDIKEIEDKKEWDREPLSLKEICARAVYTGKVQIELTKLPEKLYHYLLNVEKCTFCHGPYFQSYVLRNRCIEKNEQQVPLEYRLCTNHWNNDKERLSLLFCGSPMAMSPQSHDTSGRHSLNQRPANLELPTSQRGLKKFQFSRSMNRLQQPLLTELVEKPPSLPLLPNYTLNSVVVRSLARTSFSSRRSLSIYVP
ncbi:outer arm dynein light chain 1, partial [Neoconidiobolus thromboides FSU 785]